jgi:hypothetical protein
MTLSRGIRGSAGGFPRAVAHVAAAVLAVTAMLAAMWVGPLAAASADTQPRAAFSSPAPASAPVKFYIVPPPGNGPAESLFSIAAKTLGDGSQFVEIFNLNKGRLQPNGGRLTNPQLIEPGWILLLPADAAGPGVRFGPLPVVTAPTSHRPSRSAGTGSAIMISGALLAFLTAGLALRLIRPRAGRTRRRRPAPVRAPGVAGRASRGGLQHDHDRYMTGAAPRADITPLRGPVRQERPAGVIDRVRPGAAWVQPGRVQVWDAGSVELATWIISEASQQAADIRHEARDQMAASLADARQEAAELVRNASEQAAATVTAAEQEAAEIRAAVTKPSADLGGVAAQVTQNLAGFAPSGTKPLTRPAAQPGARPAAEPVTEPEARPAAQPATQPGTKPETGPKSSPAGPAGPRPAAKPGTRPAAKPGTRPAAKPTARSAPEGRPRRLVAIRVAAVATASLVLFAVIAGTTEVALHGFPFFVFRSAGTGETGPNGLKEDQGPGQPDAPRPAPSHVKVRLSPHSTATVPEG